MASYTLTIAPDDHGHDPSTATSIAIGESVAFTLYGNDTDYLRFQAEAGQDYHVDVDYLTSVWGMPRVAIHDSSGLELASFGLDEEIIVESPGSGDYYIAATMEPEGFGGGTLLVFSSEDDHGDSVEGATVVEVGETVRGVVYPVDDPDFFVFQAEGGKFYEIGVAGNLYDARIDLFDSDEALLESFGSKAVWKTERAGEYYIEVTGDYGTPRFLHPVRLRPGDHRRPWRQRGGRFCHNGRRVYRRCGELPWRRGRFSLPRQRRARFTR